MGQAVAARPFVAVSLRAVELPPARFMESAVGSHAHHAHNDNYLHR